MMTSWQPTLFGFLAGVMNYIVNLGAELPTDAKGWGVVMLSAAITALGVVSKQSNVSNAPNPVGVPHVVK
jgi:hypothetical protein